MTEQFEQAKRDLAELLMQSESLQGSIILIEQFLEQHAELGKYLSIETELQRAKKIHPDWPADLYVQLAVMQEEAGEVAKAILDFSFHKGPAGDIKKELIQTAAMCMRMLENFGIETADADLTALLEQHKEVILEFTEWTSKEGWVFHARTNTWVWHNRIGVVRKTSTELYDEYFKKAKK